MTLPIGVPSNLRHISTLAFEVPKPLIVFKYNSMLQIATLILQLKEDTKYSLRTLNAQSWGVTLAPLVLPRRLARELAGAQKKFDFLCHYLQKSNLILQFNNCRHQHRRRWIERELIVQNSPLLSSDEERALSQSPCGRWTSQSG